MSWRNSLLMGAGLLLLLAVVYFIQQPFRDITTPPPEQAREYAGLDANLSYLSIPVRLPLEAIQNFANQEIPETLVNKTEDRRFKARFLGIPTTIEGEVRTVVVRHAPITVRTRDDWLELAVPLRFFAEMDGESILDPDAKTRGAVTITARFRLSIDEQWQPQLQADARYHWDQRPYLRVGPVRMRVSSLIGKELEDRLDRAIAELKDKVNNDLRLQQRAAERWHELHQVRPLSDRLGAWLIVDPEQAYFQPIRYLDDALEFEFGIAAVLRTAVGQVPAPPEPEPLPLLTLTTPAESGFSLQLPIHLNYAGITRQLNEEHAGKTFELEQGTLTPKEFRIYASESALVVAARISAKAPTRLLNTHGWVYLLGEPHYDPEKRFFYVDNLEFSRQVDNPLVSGATWVLQDALREKVGRALQFDLNERIEEIRVSANEQLNRPLGEGFMLQGTLDELNLAYILPQEKDLLLVLNARGQLAIRSVLNQVQLSEDSKNATPQ